MLGPFYEPGTPVRTSVGSGYMLSGAVLGAKECKPIRKARIEVWLTNPRGEYDDAHRATVFAGERGGYRFESNVPVSYGGRPPHIHVRVTAPGYEELVTQHYPERGQRRANFDLVLVAE
jgi:catechol 1,2-dioxygenase